MNTNDVEARVSTTLKCHLLDYDHTPNAEYATAGKATVTGADAYRLSQGLHFGITVMPPYVDIGCCVEVPGVGTVAVTGRLDIGVSLILTWGP